MRVKLQLVICQDDGHEETVTDVIALNKNNQRIEHLGLSLADWFGSHADMWPADAGAQCKGNGLSAKDGTASYY
jgi:hypothetical protein